MAQVLDWNRMKSFGVGVEHAFEALCVQIFSAWCTRTQNEHVDAIHGVGGDGGVEAFCTKGTKVYGLQAKYFNKPMKAKQKKQLEKSFKSAAREHPTLAEFIVCFPRDLTKGIWLKKGELEHWNKFVNWCAKEKPSVKITKWGQAELVTELAQSNTDGLFSIWFGKQLFTSDYLARRYSTAREAYFNDRYLPDLHVATELEHRICTLSAPPTLLASLSAECAVCQRVLRFASDALTQLSASRVQALQNKHKQKWLDTLDAATSYIAGVGGFMEALQQSLEAGSFQKPSTDEFDLATVGDAAPLHEASTAIDEIEKLPSEHWRLYGFKKAVDQAIGSIRDIHDLCSRFDAVNSHLSIVGAAGVGKTHAMIHALGELSDAGVPVVLVAGKSVNVDNGWPAILGRALDVQAWSLRDILQALDTSAWLQDIKMARQSLEKVPPTRFLIAVDGLEEAKSWPQWPDHLAELLSELRDFPRGRLIVSTRTSVSARALGHAAKHFASSIPGITEQTNLPAMFRRYCEHFDIDYSEAPWIGWCVTSALSVRYFALLHRRQKLTNSRPLLDWQRMIAKLCEAIDEEIASNLQVGNHSVGGMTEKLLHGLVQDDHTAEPIDPAALTELVSQQLTSRIGPGERAEPVVERLRAWGLLDHRIVPTKDSLSGWRTVWHLASQPIVDFVVGRKLYNAQKAGSLTSASLTRIASMHPEAAQVAANFLMNEGHHVSVLWANDLRSEQLNEIVLRTLATAPAPIAAPYIDWVQTLFTSSMPECRSVLGNTIIPLSRHPSHPLNVAFVDSTLRQLRAADRDLFWSGPDFLPHNQDGPWEGHALHPLDNVSLGAIDSDKTMPLLFAWGLATVVQERRALLRDKLARWGVGRLGSMAELLTHVRSIDDTQIIHDTLLACLGAIVESDRDDADMEQLATAAMRFCEPSVPLHLRHAGIRHAARMIVERAHRWGAVGTHDVLSVRPPYPPCDELLPVAPEGVEGEPNRDTTKLLFMDLGWYVAAHATDGFVWQLQEPQTGEPRQLALDGSDIARVADLSAVSPSGISARQFRNGSIEAVVRRFGWDDGVFLGVPKGGGPGEILGPDVAIRRNYPAHTHGSKSPVMSFAEKYVRQAVPIVSGNLAERIPYGKSYDDDPPRMLEDYSVLSEAVVEPFLNIGEVKGPAADPPHRYTDLLYPHLTIQGSNARERISSFVGELLSPPLGKLRSVLNVQTEGSPNAILAARCFLHNLTIGTEALLWVASAIIPSSDVDGLVALVDKGEVSLDGDPDSCFESATGSTYRSPTFLTVADCVKSSDGYAVRTTSDSQADWTEEYLRPTCDKNVFCVGDDEDEQYSPGEVLRKQLDIAYVSGGSSQRTYLNAERRAVANYKSIRPIGGFQDLVEEFEVGMPELLRAMRQGSFSIIWTLRILWQAHHTAGLEAERSSPSREDRIFLIGVPRAGDLDINLLDHRSKLTK